MKKGIIITGFILLIVLNVLLVSADEIKNCRNECTNEKKVNTLNCSLTYLSCKDSCNGNRASLNICSKEKTSCIKTVNSEFPKCSKKCSYLGKNINCLNGRYSAGDVFLDKCQECVCQYNSRVSCKKTDFCNFNDVLNDSKICSSNNGLYQQLCNGPYFDIVCSKSNFCLCDGNNLYTCPENYYCLHDFNPSLTRRGYTISGWKTLLGVNLGNIGICVKKPELELCGNGICDNVLITGKEAETKLNCPVDCS
jgi:hypothetical protein